jgi:hypothetical protein
VIDELPVEVLDAPLNLALVLRIRRMRKINLNTALTAPFLPLLLELAAVIGKSGLRKPPFCLSNMAAVSAVVNSWAKLFTTSLSTTLNAQVCSNALLKSLTASSTLKASADGSIVITLTPGLTIIFYSHKASEAGSIC